MVSKFFHEFMSALKWVYMSTNWYNFYILQEYFIWGAEIKVADKDFYSYGHKYQLKFLKSAGIRPVEGELSMKENGATSSATASTSHIAKTTGAEDTKKIKLAFDPVPLEEVENYKSEPHFGKLCIILRNIITWQ